MEESLRINDHILIPGHELTCKASRASGPGGQHVNKTSSRITLIWNLLNSAALSDDERSRLLVKLGGRLTKEGELLISVEDERSQKRNRELARQRLRELLLLALRRRKKRIPSAIPKGVKERRLRAKAERSQLKHKRRVPHEDD